MVSLFKKRRYPTKTMTDADDQTLLADTLAQIERPTALSGVNN